MSNRFNQHPCAVDVVVGDLVTRRLRASAEQATVWLMIAVGFRLVFASLECHQSNPALVIALVLVHPIHNDSLVNHYGLDGLRLRR